MSRFTPAQLAVGLLAGAGYLLLGLIVSGLVAAPHPGAGFTAAMVALAWTALAAAALTLLHRAERDASRRQAAAAEEERTLRRAQKMDAIGRLAGGLAHDVNNYLAAIRAHCELVERKELPRQRVVEKMNAVVATVIRASALLERLLALARRQPGNPERLGLGEIVDSVLSVVQGSFPPSLVVETDIARDLWPVEIDLAHGEQILTNLLLNAADSFGATNVAGSQPGTASSPAANGRIAVRAANRPAAGADGDLVVLEVSDNGSGIPAALQDQVFEPFFTTKEGRGATGLGLSTVYGLVAEAGGRIELNSEPGRGSTFRVLLPRADPPESRASELPANSLDSSAVTAPRLLLVDDMVEVRRAAAALLRSRGYLVREASGLGEALAVSEPIDLVVTDVRLADGTGPDLVAELRRRRTAVTPHAPRLPVVYMSGYTDRIVLRGATRGSGIGQADSGESFFLKKPFSADGLERLVRAQLAAVESTPTAPPSSDQSG